jgi:hypothetical protein
MRGHSFLTVLEGILLFILAFPGFGPAAGPEQCAKAAPGPSELAQAIADNDKAEVDALLRGIPRLSLQGAKINCQKDTSLFENKDLRRFSFSGATIENCSFDCSLLDNANFDEATLRGCTFNRVSAKEAYFRKAHLEGVAPSDANFTSAVFDGATLLDVGFSKTPLTNASFKDAKIQSMQIPDADFRFADLTGATLSIPEPDPAQAKPGPVPCGINALPSSDHVVGIKGLKSVIVHPHGRIGMIALRKKLREAGCVQEARELTYALEHRRTKELLTPPSDPAEYLAFPFMLLEALGRWVFFDLISGYGLSPWRVLVVLAGVIAFCALLYLCPLAGKCTAKVRRTTDPPGQSQGEPWVCDPAGGKPGPVLRLLGRALYFSLLAATTVGWREINIGIWLKRLQKEEYDLKPTGWLRVATGLQALVSTYLLALWFLVFFGAPFD